MKGVGVGVGWRLRGGFGLGGMGRGGNMYFMIFSAVDALLCSRKSSQRGAESRSDPGFSILLLSAIKDSPLSLCRPISPPQNTRICAKMENTHVEIPTLY